MDSAIHISFPEKYSNASGVECFIKCQSMYPCLWNCSNHPSKPCCQNIATCKSNCSKAAGLVSSVVHSAGVGTGRRKACKETGLTGAEKRACAKDLKSRGWKKGDPIPPDMFGITPDDVEAELALDPAIDPELASDPNEAKTSITTENILFYTGISVAGIIGISLLIWGISSAVKSSSKQ